MARVPTAANVGRVGSPGSNARSIARQIQPGQTGEMLADLGATLSDTFTQMRESAFEESRKAALSEAAVTLPLRYEEALAGLENEAQPGAKGFTDQAQKTMEATRKSFLDELGGSYDLRESDFKLIEQGAERLALPSMSQAFRFEQTERRRFFGEKLGQQIESLALGVRRDPTQGRIDLALTQAQTAIQNGADILTPQQQADMDALAKRTVHINALEAMVEDDPEAMLERLRKGEFDALSKQGLGADDFERLENAAEVEARRLEAERKRAEREQRALLRGRVSAGLKDDVAAIRRTGESAGQVSPDQIRAAYADEPGRAERILSELEDEKAFYATRQRVALTPISEDLAILAENAPSGEGFAAEAERQDLLKRAILEKREALAKDPAGYLFQVSPGLALAFQEAEEPQDVRAATDALLEEQARLGVPRHGQRAIPNAHAAAMTADYAGQQDAQGRADWVRAQAELYGDHWPRVYGELVEAGLPGGATVLAGMTRPGQQRAAVALAEAQAEGDKGLKDAIGKDAVTAIDDALRDELADLDRTLALTPGGTRISNTYRDQITTLAMFYTRQGADPSEAAAKAAADVANDHYSFHGTYRVPREFDGNMVEERALHFRERQLTTLDLMLPPTLDDRLGEKEVKRQYIDNIATYGYWVTNQDETGLLLFDQQGRTVMQRTGEPVEVLFDRIEELPDPTPPMPASPDDLMLEPFQQGSGQDTIGGGADAAGDIQTFEALPVNIRTFVSHLFGSRKEITEKNFAASDKEAMKRAVRRQLADGADSGVIGYGDFGGEPGQFSSFGINTNVLDSFTDPKFRLETTVGMAKWHKDGEGNIIVEDNYNFNATRDQIEEAIEQHGLGGMLVIGLQQNGIAGVLNVLGNTFGSTDDEEGTKVRINLGKVKASGK